MDRNPRGLTELVDYQVHRWELNKARRKKKAKEAHIWPLITVSREYGSLGAKIAKALGERLEWPCWDQELVHEIAQHSNAPETLFASLDEHRRDVISKIIDSLMYGNEVTERYYLRKLMHVVHTIAHHGASVVVGRGAHYVLEEHQALKVRVVAPMEDRIKGLMSRKDIGEGQARAEVVKTDAERADFMRYHYSRNITDAHGFDMVINVGPLNIEKAIDIILAGYEAKFGPLPAKN